MSARNLMIALLLGAALVVGCNRPTRGPEQTPPTGRTKALQATARSLFAPLPHRMDTSDVRPNKDEITLGRMLYYDTRLSQHQTISCNSCHDLARYGVDGLPTSKGDTGHHGDRNAPTVYNAALQIAQFWDGRSPTVEDQAKGPMMNPVEMAMTTPREVAERLKAVPRYRELFARAFPGQHDPVSLDNAARAIGAFERGLVTPSPFDRFLQGDSRALDARQQQGLSTFIQVGCASCHNGVDVGGAMFQKLGLKKSYPTQDRGREAVTKRTSDAFVFKVPSLRNVAMTGPYFHSGQIKSLDQAVRIMGEYQLGKQLTRAQVDAILAFLHGLTGELPRDYIAPPPIPAGSKV